MIVESPAPAPVTLRGYQRGDEEAVVALWGISLSMDAIGPDLFVARILLDVNFDKQGFIVAEAGRDVVGFIYAAAPGPPLQYGNEGQARAGWASVFFVHPQWRRRGIGTALLRAGMAYVRARGCSVLAISPYAPGYFWPGPDRDRHAEVIALLDKLGFTTREEPVAMDASLVGFTVPQDVLRLRQRLTTEGYTVGSLQTRYIADLLAFLSAHFNPDWPQAVRNALSRRISYEQVLLAHHGPEVVGFCLAGGYDHVAERFGPFGVHLNWRGQGLGKLLLYECLAGMRGRGLHNAFFMWTGEDDPAGHLYRRAGFQVTRRFRVVSITCP